MAAKAAAKPTAATVIEISRRSGVADVDTTADAQRRELLELAKTLNDGQRVLFVKYLRRLATEQTS